MADRNQDVSRIKALYDWLSYDLQRMKGEILKELKYTSSQFGSLHQEIRKNEDTSSRAITQEIRYSYKQNQTIYDGLASLLSSVDEKVSSLKEIGKLAEQVDALDAKVALLEQIDRALAELNEKGNEEDYKKLIESISEKTEESNRRVLDAVAAIPVAENVDYTRIVDEVGDKVLELLYEIKNNQADSEAVAVESMKVAPLAIETAPAIDYDRIIGGTSEKVVESLPYAEKIDYQRIAEITESAVATAVEKALSAIDYNHLADLVAAKLSGAEQSCDIVIDEAGIDQIAAKVAEKLNVAESIDYEKVCQAAQAAQILPDPVDYDRIAEIVEDKLATEEESTYDLVIDDEGIEAIAKSVSEKICGACAEETCVTEEVVEEAPVEEVAEEIVEESAEVEENIEDAPVESEATAELAVSFEPTVQEVDNQLVDAETGLVVRLKRSFTAKMKQSDEKVKGYYSDIKNELTSYKKINSNVSWHGDRFNYGRDTIAKINICGKTLCFYVALDPTSEEYKTTVYHQKDVSGQKAYANTPFMVKVKSDAGAKKALRLVGFLAEKIGAQKKTNFEAVDYVEEFAYESTKQLHEEGFIKITKEKINSLNF